MIINCSSIFYCQNRGIELGYRFAFNGQEKVDEISGLGNHNTALFWEYDTRLGRRWNLDPKPNASISSYSAFANNPILYTDVLGDTIFLNFFNPKVDPVFYKVAEVQVKRNINDGVYVIMAHGINSYMEMTSKNGKIENLADPIDILNRLRVNKDFDNAYKNKDKIDLIFMSCFTGANEVVINDRYFYQDTPVAQDVAKAYPGEIDVYAPDGYVLASPYYGNFSDSENTSWKKYSNNGEVEKKTKSVTEKMYKTLTKNAEKISTPSTPKQKPKKGN